MDSQNTHTVYVHVRSIYNTRFEPFTRTGLTYRLDGPGAPVCSMNGRVNGTGASSFIHGPAHLLDSSF